MVSSLAVNLASLGRYIVLHSFFFFFFFARTRSAQYKGIQWVACDLTLAPIYRIGETLRIVLVT